jgi:hypothetical protein
VTQGFEKDKETDTRKSPPSHKSLRFKRFFMSYRDEANEKCCVPSQKNTKK